jgi:hypothetical protein
MHLGQRRGAVGCIVDIGEAELPQEIADDAYHGGVVVHHEHGH